jgi:hypothetical protein
VATFTKVVFSATWAGAGSAVMCTATRPADGGAWSCRANLVKLGVPPGRVTFSFSVFEAGAAIARSPDGPRRVTYTVPPPKPTGADLTQIKPPDWETSNIGTYRVDWSAPAGYADEFLVYYTDECPRPSTKKNAGKPCYVAGTPVDVSRLDLLAKASGDARSIRVRIRESECPGGVFGSILVRARNSYGSSAFAIAWAESVFWYDPDSGEVVC